LQQEVEYFDFPVFEFLGDGDLVEFFQRVNTLINGVFPEEFFSLKVLQLYFGLIIFNFISGIHVIIITVVLTALVSAVLVVAAVLIVLVAHFYC
jgi:hypothetical protein